MAFVPPAAADEEVDFGATAGVLAAAGVGVGALAGEGGLADAFGFLWKLATTVICAVRRVWLGSNRRRLMSRTRIIESPDPSE